MSDYKDTTPAKDRTRVSATTGAQAMSAPDRIKLAQMSNRRWIEVDFEAKPSPAAVEYIRKAALPVEEIREALADDSLQGFAATRVQLRRILAILEGRE